MPLLVFFEPYNRITQYQANQAGSSESFSQLLFLDKWKTALFWVLVVLFFGLLKNIIGCYRKQKHTPESSEQEFWSDIFGKLSFKAQGISVGICLFLWLCVILFVLVPNHPTDAVKPHMANFHGTFTADNNNNLSTFGLSQIKIDAHNIYGYKRGKLSFDFRYHHYEFFHPWYLSSNPDTMSRNLRTVNYTFTRDAYNDSGIMLVGHYIKGHCNYDNQMKHVTPHYSYAIVNKYFNHKPIYFNGNSNRKIILPKPNTTMIIGWANTKEPRELEINPAGARDVDNPGMDAYSVY